MFEGNTASHNIVWGNIAQYKNPWYINHHGRFRIVLNNKSGDSSGKVNQFFKERGMDIKMELEYFDVLDENGNKTRETKLRSEVHKDGDWHRTVHIWVLNRQGEVLLQRRCATKDSYPNMLDISCAGHLSAGDDSLTGAVREMKEELDVNVNPEELMYITTIKSCSNASATFIDNEFNDMYLWITDKSINDMKYQEEEISELLFVPYERFREMVKNKQPDLVMHLDEFEILEHIIMS